jgi:hypothetical protein
MEDDIGYIGGLLTPRENLIPNIQSAYGAIIQNAPDYQYFTAPLSNQGRDTASYGTTNQLVVAPDTGVRLVNNATGEVVFAGTGYEGAQQAIDAATALSSSAGKNANWDIQVTRPGSTNFETVSTERPDVSGLGVVADIGLPILGSVLAGPLGAAAGSGLSSVAQGRSIEDALLRAAIAGGTSYLGGELFGPASGSTSGATAGINADLIPNALEGLNFGSIASTAIPAGVGGAASNLASDIIVNAITQSTPNIVGSLAGGLLNAAVPSVTSPQFPEEIVVTAPTETQVVTPPGVLPPTTTPVVTPEEIIVTAQTPTPTNTGTRLTLSGVPMTPTAPTPPPPTTPTEDIVVTAPANTPVITAPLIPPVFQPTAPTTPPADTTPPAKKDDFLGTGLTTSQFLTALGLGSSVISSLLGGGGSSTTPTTPYVSPFGGMGGLLGTGTDFRAMPAIADYERYGFGPEATFFRPEYNRLVSSAAASAPATAPAMPTYTPLI